MFSFKKKQTIADNELVAVADGISIPITDVPDEVFSQKMMGDGVAFNITGNKLYAPCNGEVTTVFPGGHAYGFKMINGAEVMLHFGLETVSLHGRGIHPTVQTGKKVKAGDVISKLDMSSLKASGLNLTTMLIVTNTNGLELHKAAYSQVSAGSTPVITLE